MLKKKIEIKIDGKWEEVEPIEIISLMAQPIPNPIKWNNDFGIPKPAKDNE